MRMARLNGRAAIGPVTAARQRRALRIYVGMVALGVLPLLFGLAAPVQAVGLGLWFPGAGFLAMGGWAWLLTPASLLLFVIALLAWPGLGLTAAPILAWAITVIAAGFLAPQDRIWAGAPTVAAALLFAMGAPLVAADLLRRRARIAVGRQREAVVQEAVTSAVLCAREPTDRDDRELTPEALGAARYLLDRALQPVAGFEGFDLKDQFQTGALRYQINAVGYALAELQCHYAPSFHGYLSRAQQNLIEKYQQRRVWNYWLFGALGRSLNFENLDPAAPENTMLTGRLGLQVGMYTLASGDQRYSRPGSIAFRLTPRVVYDHTIQSLALSVRRQIDTAPFGFYPSEPNWIYPISNHFGLAGLVAHDAIFGSHHLDELRDRWLAALDNEFTDEAGTIVVLRSSLTGLKVPLPSFDLPITSLLNTIAPERAWKMWAIVRSELASLISRQGDAPRFRMRGRGFDWGNYKRSYGGVYATILAAAREFGDEETAAAALVSLDEDCERTFEDGVLSYKDLSTLANITAAVGRFRGPGDFAAAVTKGAPPLAQHGPFLSQADYPAVLVARAHSDGEDLDLVLYNGVAPGPQTLGFENMTPFGAYETSGAVEKRFSADADGRASLTVTLDGRTPLLISPA